LDLVGFISPLSMMHGTTNIKSSDTYIHIGSKRCQVQNVCCSRKTVNGPRLLNDI